MSQLTYCTLLKLMKYLHLMRSKSIFVLKVNNSQSIHMEVKIIRWTGLKFVFKFSGIFILTHIKKKLGVPMSIALLAGTCIIICRGQGSNPGHPTYSP